MAKRLWFENSNGDKRVIKNTAETWADVHQAIQEFINRCNINKHNESKRRYGDNYDPSKVQEFKWFYTRCWTQEDGCTRIDVGSHTEFFIWEGDVKNEPDLTEDIVDG
jgi:hypothetical protein